MKTNLEIKCLFRQAEDEIWAACASWYWLEGSAFTVMMVEKQELWPNDASTKLGLKGLSKLLKSQNPFS